MLSVVGYTSPPPAALVMAALPHLLTPHRGQLQSQVSQPGDDPIQRGLVRDEASENRLVGVGMTDGQAAKPIRPLLLDVALDPYLDSLHPLLPGFLPIRP